MSPTNKLRFVERVVPVTDDFGKTVRVLQQWWTATPTMNIGFGEMPIGKEQGEWRDVPLEKADE